MTNVNSGIAEKLEWLWSLMDISDNLRRADAQAEKVGNDLLTSGIHFIAFLILSIVLGSLAWHFDLESTIIGISTLQGSVIEGLPSSAQTYSLYIGVAFSLAPTLVEIFTAAFARAQIKILQILVVGLTAFDAVTDIPRAIAFTNSLDAHFYQLGTVFGFIVKYVFFLFWLFLCTIGFELCFVILAFLTIVFFFKSMNLRKQGKGMVSVKTATSKPNKAPVVVEVES